ncbi:carboxypeptidase-like regulatory domain-containing protein [Neobacillus cucumis]|uniref:carboxypeptidase-like regulatory domain-containing protein n=1 Tax=Neobacillus cucumis TaxID=1740721 RepID=UPI0028531512|nr:carboxypeptidase-like regulatory domain-containing protein [Neobacillus cucumis]MDR4947771.1 carboxypeptidase-like regulatory domain-containing protein [Neobacillus cucumis]
MKKSYLFMRIGISVFFIISFFIILFIVNVHANNPREHKKKGIVKSNNIITLEKRNPSNSNEFNKALKISSPFKNSETEMPTRIRGEALDKKGRPVAGVKIVVDDGLMSTKTDSTGIYVFYNVPVGTHIVKVSDRVFSGDSHLQVIVKKGQWDNDEVNFTVDSRKKGIENEISHLQDLSMANEDPDPEVQREIMNAITKLRNLEENNDNFLVFRANAFIPWDSLVDPIYRNLVLWHGDRNKTRNGKSIFNVISTKSRLSQIVIDDLDANEITTVNFVGETTKYPTFGDIKKKTANNKGMKVIGDSFEFTSQVAESNPLHDMKIPFVNRTLLKAPPIMWKYNFIIERAFYDRDTTYLGLDVNFDISGFPAMESYFSVNGFPYQKILTRTPNSQNEEYALLNDYLGEDLDYLGFYGDAEYSVDLLSGKVTKLN